LNRVTIGCEGAGGTGGVGSVVDVGELAVGAPSGAPGEDGAPGGVPGEVGAPSGTPGEVGASGAPWAVGVPSRAPVGVEDECTGGGLGAAGDWRMEPGGDCAGSAESRTPEAGGGVRGDVLVVAWGAGPDEVRGGTKTGTWSTWARGASGGVEGGDCTRRKGKTSSSKMTCLEVSTRRVEGS